MKITYPPYKHRNQEATIIENSLNSYIKKYGFSFVKYVVARIINERTARMKLQKEIIQKQQELEELKNKI